MLSLKIKNAAEFVQAESGKIAGKLFEKAVRRKMNIIYEKTISTADQTLNEIRDLKKRDYLVILLATHAKVEVGLKRAEDRYLKNGRFVRPEIILDTYSKVHKSLKVLKDAVDAVVLYDNNGSSLELMYLAEDKIGKVIDKALYDEYLNTVGQEYRLDKV
jgi:predicted ABC-type ATPase